MQDHIHDTLKALYQEEIVQTRVPPFPELKAAKQAPVPDWKRVPWLLSRAAAILLLLVLPVLILANNQPTRLAQMITEVSGKYELDKKIPEGIMQIQKVLNNALIKRI